MYKQNPKSPVLKALKGNQPNLNAGLRAAIEAALESPAKQTKTLQKIKRTPETEGEKKAAQRAAQARISSDSTYTYNQLRESNSWYGEAGKASAEASSEKAGRDARAREAKRSAAKMYGKSPAKQTLNAKPPRPKMQKKLRKRDPNEFTETYNAATGSYNDPYYNPKKAESYKKNAIAKYGSLEKAREAYSNAPKSAAKMYGKSPAKQTTAGEFAHKKSLKDKEMGKSTKVVDKFTSALEAPFSDKTYSELKKEKRAKQKAKYNAKK